LSSQPATRTAGPFICEHCRRPVPAEADGTQHRNHCPYCLWSLHVDNRPGDRRAYCRGELEPIGVWVRKGGEWALIHRCQRCGSIHSNRIAGDDNELALVSLALRPLAQLPFPADSLANMAAGASRSSPAGDPA
jgi:DNA-directed RNA polymerase subunit RPC12/RpoP